VPDFVLYRAEPVTDAAAVPVAGPAVVLAEGATLGVRGARSEATLSRGDALYATPDEGPLEITGDGIAWIASTGDHAASAP
jgi:mannose-6-phosphate isomerase